MSLRWSESQRLNYTQISTLIKFFMVKFFITFYFIQYHKNAFHDELFLSVFYVLQIEKYIPVLVNHSQISAFGCIESVANKKSVFLEKKQLVKKTSHREINFQLAKFTFWKYRFLNLTRKAAMQFVNLFL